MAAHRDDLQAVTEHLTGVFGSVFDTLNGLLTCAEQILATAPTGTDDLAALDPVAIDVVQHSELVVGAGYVSAPGVLTDRDYWLQWWADYDLPRTGRPQRLQVEVDPHSEQFRDYTQLPWFAVPAETGARHVAGPYVDYLCTDEYTLTFTVPVRARDRFVGVVGADVHAQDIERLAAPMLGRLGRPAALLNEANRVLAAAGSGFVAGDLVRSPELAAVRHTGATPGRTRALPLADLPFAVVVGDAVAG